MSLALATQKVPLVTDMDGVVRIGETRVTLDTVIAAFREGLTAEEIVAQYPSLGLADVYLVIGFFLGNQESVDEYLSERQAQAEEIRRTNESRFDPAGIRDRLLARQKRN